MVFVAMEVLLSLRRFAHLAIWRLLVAALYRGGGGDHGTLIFIKNMKRIMGLLLLCRHRCHGQEKQMVLWHLGPWHSDPSRTELWSCWMGPCRIGKWRIVCHAMEDGAV